MSYPIFSSLVNKLFEAIEHSDADAVKELIAEAEKIEKKVALVNVRKDYEVLSITPLMEAANSGDERIVKILLVAGAKVNEAEEGKLSDRWTPLHYAAYRGHAAIVQLLVEGGATLDKKDSQDTTPLMLAVEERNYETVAYLYKQGASLREIDDYRRNVLDRAKKI